MVLLIFIVGFAVCILAYSAFQSTAIEPEYSPY
jgi:hypothetical protein